VFLPNTFTNVPALTLGRACFDQWLIKDARTRGIPVVDITRVARAIHQNHEYLHIDGGQQGAYWGEEARRNLAIYGGVPHTHTLLDVSHELSEDKSPAGPIAPSARSDKRMDLEIVYRAHRWNSQKTWTFAQRD